MISVAYRSSHRSKGITQTVYTVLLALIFITFLILVLILFIQRFYDIQLTIQETEQDRGVINLAQALLSSDKLVYVESVGSSQVLHRGVMDADKAKNVNMDDLRKEFSYSNFYYTLTITDLDKSTDITPSIGVGESAALFANYRLNRQKRNYPISIRYVDGTTDAGVMSIETGFISSTEGPSNIYGVPIPSS